jgi:hypothetical protein
MNTLIGPISESTASAIGVIAPIISLLCIIPMCVALFKPYDAAGRSHPPPVTWGLWFFVGLVATVGIALGGAPFASWGYKLGLSLGPIIVALLAVWRKEPVIATRIDRLTFYIGTGGLLLYIVIYTATSDPVAAGWISVIAAMVVDTIAAWPTWHSAMNRHAPMAEVITFAIAWVTTTVVLLTLPVPWTFLSAGIFVFLWFQMLSIIITLLIGRKRITEDTAVILNLP